MVLFHPHEGCFQVRFGITVPVFSHNLKTFLIFHQTGPTHFQFFVELLDFRFLFPFPVNETDPFLSRNPKQVLLQLQDLKRGTAVDLNDRMIGNLLMLCQLPLSVFFNNLPDFIHSFNHKHMGFPKIIFGAIAIFKQKRIVPFIKGVNRIQKACKMIVKAAPPDKGIPVCVCFDFGSIDIQFFQSNKPFLLQTAHKLAVQFIQDFPCQFLPFKIVESIPLGFLPFGKPDKGKVPLAQIYNPVYRPDAPHICIGNDSIHHDWIVPGSPFIRIAGQQA